MTDVYLIDSRSSFEKFINFEEMNPLDKVDQEDVLVYSIENGKLCWWFAPPEVAKRIWR